MTKKDASPSALGAATLALDEKLQLIERLAADALHLPLDSEKNIARTAKALGEAAECQRDVLARVQAMIQALQVARERNEATANRLQARRVEVEGRSGDVDALMTRFAVLGKEAKELSDALSRVRKADDAGPAGDPAPAELEAVDARMTALLEQAADLARAAAEANLTDVGDRAEALRQQLQAARNKVKLLLQRLAERRSQIS
jgi:hypothetical protein